MENEHYHLSGSQEETKQLVARYEEMVHNQRPVYFDSDDLILIAEYYAYNNQPADSSHVLEYALKLHPDNLEILLYHCRALIAEGKLEEAEKILDNITDQKDREVSFLRIEILLEKSQFEKADILIKKLAEEENYSKEVLLDISDLFTDFYMPEKAYEWLAPLYERMPEDDEVRESMVRCTFDLKQYDKTITIINAQLDDNPYNVESWINLGRCYLETKQTEKMFEALDFALSIEPNREDILHLTGLCCIEIKNYEKGFEMFSKLLNLNSQNLNALHGISTCLTNLGDFKRAIIYQTKAIDHFLPKTPNKEKAFFFQQRAFSYIMTKELDAAMHDLNKALEYDDTNSIIYMTAANYYLIKNDIQKALKEVGYAELYAENDESVLKEILMFYFQNTFFNDTIRIGKKLEQIFGEKETKKYSYVMAYSYYALNNQSEEMIKYMVRTIVYNPKLLTLTEKSNFADLARKVNQLIKQGIIKKENYL